MPSGFLLCGRSASYQRSYSSHRTSQRPIQNGSSLTSTGGPSSGLRPASPSLLPIVNVPPAIGTMSNVTSLPGIFSLYAANSAAAGFGSCAAGLVHDSMHSGATSARATMRISPSLETRPRPREPRRGLGGTARYIRCVHSPEAARAESTSRQPASAALPRRGRTALLAGAITIATLLLIPAAVVLANFGPGAGWILLLLAIPLTIGRPTTIAVLTCVSLWNGPPLLAFAALCAVTGFLAQFAAMGAAARLRRRGGA